MDDWDPDDEQRWIEETRDADRVFAKVKYIGKYVLLAIIVAVIEILIIAAAIWLTPSIE